MEQKNNNNNNNAVNVCHPQKQSYCLDDIFCVGYSWGVGGFLGKIMKKRKKKKKKQEMQTHTENTFSQLFVR